MDEYEIHTINFRKLACFRHSCNFKHGINPTKVLKQPGDINTCFPLTKSLKVRNPDLIGCGMLHLTQQLQNKKLFDKIIKMGANFTIGNLRNLTVLQQSIESKYDNFKDDWCGGLFQTKILDLFANSVLDAHVKWKNTMNPYDNNGISHFHIACMVDHSKAAEFFLCHGVPVNRWVNDNSPIFAGCTPLHIAGLCSSLETVKVLLKYGVDKYIENFKKMTPLCTIVSRNIEIIDWMHTRDTTIFCFAQLKSDVSAKEKIIKLILSESTDETNVIDELGFSDFHAACTLEDTSVAEQFLEKGVDINHRVKMESPVWPGYTALHFAAHFNVKMVKLLINNGAAISAKALFGVTPFDICAERFSVEDLHIILSSNEIWRNIKLSDETTTLLDLMYVLRDVEQMSNFFKLRGKNVNAFIPCDSPLWRGCYILHLVTLFTETIKIVNDYSSDDDDSDHWSISSDLNERLSKRRRTTNCSYIRRIQTCLDNGADVTAANMGGTTPIHLAFRLQKFDAVNLMLNTHPDKVNPINKHNLSHLYIACYTKNTRFVKTLLSSEKDVNIALSPTFHWFKNNRNYINRYRSLDFKSGGSTPLHAAVKSGSEEITRLLLKRGADVNAKDENGLTPLHQVLSCNYNQNVAEMLLSSPKLKDSVFNDGLSHLHLASYFGNANAVERLLDAGANIDATISVTSKSTFKDYHKRSYQPLAFMYEYSGCTPLHIALGLDNSDDRARHRHVTVAKVLIQRGADIFIRNSAGRCVAYMSLSMKQLKKVGYEITCLKRDVNLQKRMFDDSGLTMLHIACWIVNVEMVKDLLSKGADVNAQAREDSPVWPKWTPMHVLMLKGANSAVDSSKIVAIFKVLLNNGANLTLANLELETPLHLTEPHSSLIERTSGVSYRTYADSPYAGLILKKLKYCKSNPTNVEEISHFHIASLRNDLKIVYKFLECGGEINRPIDFFSDRYPGCTALHLALNPETSVDISLRAATVKLLIEFGADVNAVDIYSNTALHLAVKRGTPNRAILDAIISAVPNLHALNVLGETPFDVLLKSGNFEREDLQYFFQRGCQISSCNFFGNETYIRMLAHPLVKEIIDASQKVLEIDNIGFTVIHKVVTLRGLSVENYVELIGALIRRGCDIDRQSNGGETALHSAIYCVNLKAISALLTLGVDVNLPDSRGNTAFATCFAEYGNFITPYDTDYYSEIIKCLSIYVHKIQLCGLTLHELNEKTLADVPSHGKADEDDIKKINEEINKAKSVKIGLSQRSIYDFLTSTQAWTDCVSVLDSERNAVDEFFQAINTKRFADEFPEFIGVLRLRYRKFKNA